MISKEITYRPPGLLFSVSLSTNLLCNSWIKFNWERLKTKGHCHCVTRVRKSFSPPVDPLNTWFDFYGFTEVDNDVTLGPLSQNRTYHFSWNSSDRHVLPIWTLPAPHGLSFPFHSTAAIPNISPLLNCNVSPVGFGHFSVLCFVLSGLFAVSAWSQVILVPICS